MQSRRKKLENINYCYTSRYSSTADCSWKQLFGDMTYIKHRRNDKSKWNFLLLEKWEDILKKMVEAAKFYRITNARTISGN
jgi:predicted RNA-binding protein with EMAP domain